MLKAVVLDKDTLGADIDLSPITELCDTAVYGTTEPCEVADRVKDAEVIVVNKLKLNKTNLDSAKALKLICITATGYDNIDTDYLKSRGVALCNVAGYSTASVAQVSVALVLSLATHLYEYNRFVTSGEYSASGVANKLTPVYHEIYGKRWGVVGGGAIGGAVAKVAKALGCDVVVCRNKNEGDYPVVDIDTLLKTSDIVSVHVPLNDSTKNLLSRERIETMKDGALLVNTARGLVTDEGAVADAVLSGKLGGFGCDVYGTEPFGKDHPYNKIKDLKNVILTPHMAWGAYEARQRCIEEISKNITAFLDGDTRNRIV